MRFTIALLALTVLLPHPAVAAWPTDPTVNLPVCTAAQGQDSPRIASDGAGGVIIVWEDNRGGYQNSEVYAQHVLGSGVVDPAWPVNGLAVCTAPGPQHSVRIVSDGAGGAIISWSDARVPDPQHLGNDDIYAQHVLANGAVDPAWPINGLAVCTAASTQFWPAITTDGAGGAIVAWSDARSGRLYIYAQHVLASGVVDPTWPVDGRGLCLVGWQVGPGIVADGTGGAIVTWQDYRTSYESSDIYAQHVLATGVVDPAWPAVGRGVCTAASAQYSPAIIADGSGGAIIGWQDKRAGDFDAYVQHVLTNGAVDPAWPVNGLAVCTAANDQIGLDLVAGGAGSVIVAWDDARSGNFDVYAQRVLASAAVDPAWPANGRALCTAASDQKYSEIVGDATGGAIVTWYDERVGAYLGDVYGQHVLASGEVDPSWPAGGVGICTAVNNQGAQVAIADGAGGVIGAWADCRSAGSNCFYGADIYAQRVQANGQLGGSACLQMAFDLMPRDLNLRSNGRWVTGLLYPPAPYQPTQIDVASIRLNQVVAVSDERAEITDDGLGLMVKFSRDEVKSALTPGDQVAVTITGTIAGECFTGTNAIRVKAPRINHPVEGEVLMAGTVTNVAWETPAPELVRSVTLLSSFDRGVTWKVEAENLPNTGVCAWEIPDVATSPVLLQIVLSYGASKNQLIDESEFVLSGPFTIAAPASAGTGVAVFGLRPENPAKGGCVVSFSLVSASPATLAAFDIGGRQVVSREVGSSGPGWHTMQLGRLPAGIYVVRLSQGGRSLSSRVAVIP